MSTLAQRMHEAYLEFEQRVRAFAGKPPVTAELVELALMELPGVQSRVITPEVTYFTVAHPDEYKSYLSLALQKGGPHTFADVDSYISAMNVLRDPSATPQAKATAQSTITAVSHL